MEGLPERYADVYRPTFAVPGLRTAVSNSVARSGAAPAGAEVENMEGAADRQEQMQAQKEQINQKPSALEQSAEETDASTE